MCKRLLNYNYILVSYENSQKRVIEMFRKYKLNNIPEILDTGYFKLDYFMKDNKKIFMIRKTQYSLLQQVLMVFQSYQL